MLYAVCTAAALLAAAAPGQQAGSALTPPNATELAGSELFADAANQHGSDEEKYWQDFFRALETEAIPYHKAISLEAQSNGTNGTVDLHHVGPGTGSGPVMIKYFAHSSACKSEGQGCSDAAGSANPCIEASSGYKRALLTPDTPGGNPLLGESAKSCFGPLPNPIDTTKKFYITFTGPANAAGSWTADDAGPPAFGKTKVLFSNSSTCDMVWGPSTCEKASVTPASSAQCHEFKTDGECYGGGGPASGKFSLRIGIKANDTAANETNVTGWA